MTGSARQPSEEHDGQYQRHADQREIGRAHFRTLSPCCRCGQVHGRVGQRLCSTCHAASMRQWRAKQRDELLRLRELDRQVNGGVS